MLLFARVVYLLWNDIKITRTRRERERERERESEREEKREHEKDDEVSLGGGKFIRTCLGDSSCIRLV